MFSGFSLLFKAPVWVYLLLIFLIWRGIVALKPRWVVVKLLFTVPVFLLVIQLFKVVHLDWFLKQIYLVSYGAGFFVGFFSAFFDELNFNKYKKAIFVPGSSLTLVISLIVFGINFFQGVLKSVAPVLLEKFLPSVMVVTGFSSGLFLGRYANYFVRYLKS